MKFDKVNLSNIGIIDKVKLSIMVIYDSVILPYI